jgi:hypothetical protein
MSVIIFASKVSYVLIAIILKELKINTSLYTLLQILSVSVFEKSEISCAFQPGRQNEDNEDDPKQLILLGF